MATQNPINVYNTCDCDTPLTIPVRLDMVDGVAQEIDLSNNWNLAKIKGLQTVYIDNADNSAKIEIVENVTRQRIICTGNSQGFFPILAGLGFKFTARMIGGDGTVNFQFGNFVAAPGVWSV